MFPMMCSGKSCYIRQAALIAIMAQVCTLCMLSLPIKSVINTRACFPATFSC